MKSGSVVNTGLREEADDEIVQREREGQHAPADGGASSGSVTVSAGGCGWSRVAGGLLQRATSVTSRLWTTMATKAIWNVSAR